MNEHNRRPGGAAGGWDKGHSTQNRGVGGIVRWLVNVGQRFARRQSVGVAFRWRVIGASGAQIGYRRNRGERKCLKELPARERVVCVCVVWREEFFTDGGWGKFAEGVNQKIAHRTGNRDSVRDGRFTPDSALRSKSFCTSEESETGQAEPVLCDERRGRWTCPETSGNRGRAALRFLAINGGNFFDELTLARVLPTLRTGGRRPNYPPAP